MLDLFLLCVVDLGSLLIGLLAGALDDGMGTLLGLGEDRLLHFLNTLLDVSCHHFVIYLYLISWGQAKEIQENGCLWLLCGE